MYHSSKTGELSTLDEYVARLKEGQEQIYYLAGNSVAECEKSPLVEKLLKKGYEVLFMVDPIDEYTLQNLPKYDGEYKLTNIARENLKLDGEQTDEDLKKEQEEEFKPVLEFIKNELKSKLEKVVLSNRLTTSPVAIVSSQFGYTANMERVMRAQALSDPKSRGLVQLPRKVMEVNPRHPILRELRARLAADPADEAARITTRVLYETAMLTSGFGIDDMADYSAWVHRMMQLNLNLSPDAVADEEPEYVAPPAPAPAPAPADEFHEEL